MKKILAAILILIPAAMSAQESTGTVPSTSAVSAESSSSAALPFVDYIKSARTASMAGLNSSLPTDANAHWGNIAYASFAEKTANVSAGYGLWQPSVTKGHNASVAGIYAVTPKIAVTAAVASSFYAKEKVFDEEGVLTGRTMPVDLSAGVGVSYRFIDCLSAGVSLNYLMSRTSAETLNGFSADVQLLFRKYGVNVSLAACTLGPNVKSGWHLPMNAALEAGYGYDFGKSHIYGALQGKYYFAGPSAYSAGVAVEYVWNGMLSARGGYHYGSGKNGLPSFGSVGLGCCFAGVNIDLAYIIASGPMKNSLLVGLGYSF